jgi:hypothetical protein
MNDKTRRVVRGWLHLSPEERQEFDAEVQRFQKSGSGEQRNLSESIDAAVNKMQTGPMGGTCACCGR